MYGGYLVIETDNAHPGVVRILETATLPPEDRGGWSRRKGPQACYVARFEDLSAGHMHAHAALRRRLLDVNLSLYRCEPIDAAAAVEGSELAHRTTYLDPKIATDPRFAALIAARHRRRRLLDRIWRTVGIAAILLLVLRLLLGP